MSSSSHDYFDPAPVHVYEDGAAVHRAKHPDGGPSFGFVTFEPGGRGQCRAREVTLRIPASYIAELVGAMSRSGLTDRDPDRDELGLTIAAAAWKCLPEMTQVLLSTIMEMIATQLGTTDPEAIQASCVEVIKQWAVTRCKAAGKGFPAQAWREANMDEQIRERAARHEPGPEVKAWLEAWLDQQA